MIQGLVRGEQYGIAMISFKSRGWRAAVLRRSAGNVVRHCFGRRRIYSGLWCLYSGLWCLVLLMSVS
jgi:hypothetical protein